MDQDRQPTPRASNRSCVAHRRADFPETGLRSSQHVPARTTDVSASSPHEATQPITQAFLQSTLPASTIFESWLPMDSEIVRKGNCNAKRPSKAMSSALPSGPEQRFHGARTAYLLSAVRSPVPLPAAIHRRPRAE